MEKRGREMAMQIQQLENELQMLRKSKGKAGMFPEFQTFANFLRLPKPTSTHNKLAYVEARRIIDLILVKTIEVFHHSLLVFLANATMQTVTSRNLKSTRSRQNFIGVKSASNSNIASRNPARGLSPPPRGRDSPPGRPPPTPPRRPMSGSSPVTPKVRAFSEVIVPKNSLGPPPVWARYDTIAYYIVY